MMMMMIIIILVQLPIRTLETLALKSQWTHEDIYEHMNASIGPAELWVWSE